MRLEMKHRKEEDDLYRKFARQREEEEFKFKEEFRVSEPTSYDDSIVILYTQWEVGGRDVF